MTFRPDHTSSLDDAFDEELGDTAQLVMQGVQMGLPLVIEAGKAIAKAFKKSDKKKAEEFTNYVRDNIKATLKPENKWTDEMQSWVDGREYETITHALWANPLWVRQDVVAEAIALIKEGVGLPDALINIQLGPSPMERNVARRKGVNTMTLPGPATQTTTLPSQSVAENAAATIPFFAQQQDSGANVAAMMSAFAPMMAQRVSEGGDTFVRELVVSMPDQIKAAVRDVVASVREGDLAEKNARATLVANVDAALHPKLAQALSALEQQRLQQAATQEHRSIVRRDTFENTVAGKLDRLDRNFAKLVRVRR